MDPLAFSVLSILSSATEAAPFPEGSVLHSPSWEASQGQHEALGGDTVGSSYWRQLGTQLGTRVRGEGDHSVSSL